MLRDQTVTGVVRALLFGFAALLVAGFAMLAFILGEPAAPPIAITGGVLLGMFLALTGLIFHRLVQPLDRLALDVGIVARENLGHYLGLGQGAAGHPSDTRSTVMRGPRKHEAGS